MNERMRARMNEIKIKTTTKKQYQPRIERTQTLVFIHLFIYLQLYALFSLSRTILPMRNVFEIFKYGILCTYVMFFFFFGCVFRAFSTRFLQPSHS